MKCIKRYHLILLLFLVCIQLIAQEVPGLPFVCDIKISVNKSEYNVCEPIYLSVKIDNYADPGPKIEGMAVLEGLTITDSDREECIFINQITHPPDAQMVGFSSREYYFDITQYFDNNQIYEKYKDGRSLIVPGRYHVRCIHREFGHEPIVSNPVMILIVEPIGDEFEVYEKFISVYKYSVLRNKPKLALSVYDDIIMNNPNSSYFFNALKEKHLLSTIKPPALPVVRHRLCK